MEQTPMNKLLQLLEDAGYNFLRFKKDIDALKQYHKDYIRRKIIDAYNAGYEDMEGFHKNDAINYANQIIKNYE